MTPPVSNGWNPTYTPNTSLTSFDPTFAGLRKPSGEAAGHDDPSHGSSTPGPRKAASVSAEAPAGDSKVSQLIRPAHSEGGPTAGLVAKTQELLQRFKDTPGDTFNDRCVGLCNPFGVADEHSSAVQQHTAPRVAPACTSLALCPMHCSAASPTDSVLLCIGSQKLFIAMRHPTPQAVCGLGTFQQTHQWQSTPQSHTHPDISAPHAQAEHLVRRARG